MLRKRIISLLLVLCMLFTALPFQAFAAEEIIASGEHDVGRIKWKITSDGILTLYGEGTMTGGNSYYSWDDYVDVVTKVVVEGGVVNVAPFAFDGMKNLQQVVIEEGVQTLDENSFGDCPALKTVSFPASLQVIDCAFIGCPALQEISFDPDTVSLSIYRNAFTGCDVRELTIPGGVKVIGRKAFSECNQLTKVNLAEGVEEIHREAFAECFNLGGYLCIPSTVTMLEPGSFDSAANWDTIEIRTAAQDISFQNFTNLKQVVFAGDVTVVPNDIVWDCTSLESVVFNSDINKIGDGAFQGCSALKTITLPASLVSIGGGAFGNSGLTEIVVPDGVTEVAGGAFGYCRDLVSAKLGASVETLGNGAFAECEKLETVDLANVRNIGSESFTYASLKSVVIPETVEWIDHRAFGFCEGLTEIHFLGDAPEFHSNADSFQDVTATAYYNPEREGWTDDVMQDYGGNILWVVEGHEHSYTSVVTPATCTTDGYTTHTCEGCDHSYTDTPVEALGHNLTAWETSKEATCTENGSRTQVCNTCKEVFTEEISAFGHSYVDGICTGCGEEEPAITAPRILSCYSKQQTSVKVTWTPEEGADGYELWRTSTPDNENSWSRIKTVNDGSQDRYTNQGLEKGVTYYYKVRAFQLGSGGEKYYSDFSEVDYMPAAIVWDGPYSNAINRIRLRWNEIGGSHGYQIWIKDQYNDNWYIVKTLGDKGNELTNNQGATTAYSNTARNAGEKYTYKMRAFMITEDGRKVFGAYSDEITVAVMPDIPEATAASPKEGRVLLRWDAVHGADGYQVWMYSDGNWSIIKSVTDGSTSYTKTGLQAGQEYQFRVRAYTEVDGKKTFGAYSEIISSIANGPVAVAGGKCGDNLTWTLDDVGTLTISGTGAMYSYEGDTPPWQELDVRKAVVESGVTTIGAYAFSTINEFLSELTEISLPSTLKEIGFRAFSASQIQKINIPNSVTNIGDYAFSGSAITSVTWPKGTKVLNSSVFEDCYYLKEVVIPEGITTLGFAAFRGCQNLESVSLPGTLKVIEDYAFSHCNTLQAASLPDSVTTMESAVFEDCLNLEVVYLPQSLTTIRYAMFRGCSSLQAVLLPEKLTVIEANAFSGCDALIELYFPGTEEQLGNILVHEGNEPLQYVTVYLVKLEEED